jgi:hypothetical protein
MFLTVALNLFDGSILAKKSVDMPRISVMRKMTIMSSRRVNPGFFELLTVLT